MTDTLERAARAAFESFGGELFAGGKAWEEQGQSLREAFRAHARAVLEAFRSPSEAMVEACLEAMSKHGIDFWLDAREVTPMWQAMIDAILAEK